LASGQQTEFDQGVWRIELMLCPECGAESPKMRRCLSCGHNFNVEEEDEIEKGEGDRIEVLPGKMQEEDGITMENTELAMEPVATFVSKRENECDPATRDVMEDLVKGLSMQLWSVDMLQEKKVTETQFEL
jgi:hypothetical protein